MNERKDGKTGWRKESRERERVGENKRCYDKRKKKTKEERKSKIQRMSHNTPFCFCLAAHDAFGEAALRHVIRRTHKTFVQCTMRDARCAMYDARCTTHSTQCTAHNTQRITHNVQRTMQNAQRITQKNTFYFYFEAHAARMEHTATTHAPRTADAPQCGHAWRRALLPLMLAAKLCALFGAVVITIALTIVAALCSVVKLFDNTLFEYICTRFSELYLFLRIFLFSFSLPHSLTLSLSHSPLFSSSHSLSFSLAPFPFLSLSLFPFPFPFLCHTPNILHTIHTAQSATRLSFSSEHHSYFPILQQHHRHHHHQQHQQQH